MTMMRKDAIEFWGKRISKNKVKIGCQRYSLDLLTKAYSYRKQMEGTRKKPRLVGETGKNSLVVGIDGIYRSSVGRHFFSVEDGAIAAITALAFYQDHRFYGNSASFISWDGLRDLIRDIKNYTKAKTLSKAA